MELRADSLLPFPRSVVFQAYRDDLVKLLPYLPNVRGIEVKSREEQGDVVKMLNVWKGGGEIPAAARAFLSEAMLSWDDIATWNAADFTCAWHIKTHAFTEAVRCEGKNRFVEEAGGTRLEIRGVLEIDARKIKGVPSLLAGKVGKMVEEVLAGKIQPNLVEVSRGLEKYLAERAK
jgi:hypothetical protein